MESLNNYIVERIRIDNVKPVFPVDGTVEDIIDFLKEQGFEEIKGLPSFPSYTDYVVPFNKYKNKCFFIEKWDVLTYIYFANTSKDKISKSNVLYVIRFDPEISTPARDQRIGVYSTYVFGSMNEDEFEKEMESYFG